VGEKGEVWGINRGWKSGREVVKRWAFGIGSISFSC
jgi:hypothetical protein